MSANDVFKLLQPALLTEEQLVQVLQSRCINIRNMGAMSKEQLIDIYERVVTPLEQRPCRRSGNICDTTNTDNSIQNHMKAVEYAERNVKKIKLNNDSVVECTTSKKVILKRKHSSEMKTEVSPKKVRQRIVWP